MSLERIAAGLALAAGVLFATVAHAEEKTMERTITVSAEGQAIAEPDIAHLDLGVTSEARTAAEALARNTQAMSEVVTKLKARDIDAKDIQTASFDVNPRYTQPKDNTPATISGYQVTNSVAVTIRDLGKLGGLLDEIVTAGANQINGLTFEASKAETLRDEARKTAVANARRRAELLATASGAQLGDVLTISEGVSEGPIPYPRGRAEAFAKAAPIERGTVMLQASVTVTWALK